MSLPPQRTVIGIDYSMNSPGVCVKYLNTHRLFGFVNNYNGNLTYDVDKFQFTITENVEVYSSPIDRFDKLARKILWAINRFECNEPAVYIEGYSMGSKGQVFHIAENTAILKHYFHRIGIEVIEVAPTTIKKYATGKGNAKKEDMYDAFVAKTGIDLRAKLIPTRKLGSPVTDLVDAYYIAEYGREQEESKKNANQEKRST